MIKTLITRCRLIVQTLQHRCAREVSRGTLIVLVSFGSCLMLVGGLFTCALAETGYGHLRNGGLGIVRGDYYGIVLVWIIALLLLFGGNLLRAVGWSELRKQRTNAPAAHRSTKTIVLQSTTTGILSVLVALVMLFWGATALVSVFHTLQTWPAGSWLNVFRSLVVTETFRFCVWWSLIVAWLTGGFFLLWIGYRSLFRRPLMRE